MTKAVLQLVLVDGLPQLLHKRGVVRVRPTGDNDLSAASHVQKEHLCEPDVALRKVWKQAYEGTGAVVDHDDVRDPGRHQPKGHAGPQ